MPVPALVPKAENTALSPSDGGMVNPFAAPHPRQDEEQLAQLVAREQEVDPDRREMEQKGGREAGNGFRTG